MAKTLVIKEANYSANAFDQVEFYYRIPCTGVSLDKQTAEIASIGGTTTIVCTVTPQDTTDQISWASSDGNVATVANGVVTTTGLGTATITVTCGEQSATCVVTSRAFMDTENVLKRIGYYADANPASSGGSGSFAWDTASSRRGGFASSTGDLSIYALNTVFPYVMPNGTKKIKFTFASGSSISEFQGVYFFNSETSMSSSYPTVCKLISSVTGITISGGVAVVNVPEVEGFPEIDAFVVNMAMASGTITSEILDTVTIEFLPE